MAQIDFLGDPVFQAIDLNGVPLAGGQVWCYDAGTDNLRNMYSTITDAINQTSPIDNPIALDTQGRYPIVYSGASKFVLENNDIDPMTGHGSVIWTADNIGRFGNSIIDPNGNLIVEYDYQTNAGNYFKIKNAPSGTAPSIETAGADSSVGVTIRLKGTTQGLSVQNDSFVFRLPIMAGVTGDVMTLDASGNVIFQAPPGVSGAIAPGIMAPFAGTAAPTGWLACDGSAVSRSTYSALFAAIGTTWGVGDGVNTFNLPNMQGYTWVGSGGTSDALLGNAVGNSGGERAHALTSAENGPHTHSQSDATNKNTATSAGGLGGWWAGTTSSATGSSGSGTPHNNIQPSKVALAIIKT